MASSSTLQYVQFDYQSQKNALQQRIRARYPNLWNDFLAGGFGTVIIDVVAFAMATLAFLINRQAAEQFIPTMTLRESAVRVGALVGYQLRGPTAATVSCEAALQSVQSANVTIPQGTLIHTTDDQALPFEVANTYVIAAGQLTPQTLVISVNPNLSGANVLATTAIVTSGSLNIDMADSTIDLTQYVSVGQTFQATGDTNTYTITDIESSPGAISNNRLVVATPWTGATGTVTGTVFDQRIQLLQGQTVTDSFSAPSTDTTAFSVMLSTTPVINGSVQVTVNGAAWTSISSLTLAASDQTSFQVTTFASGITVVQFGDNTFGEALPTNAIISVTYRTGGGAAGNIDLNTINSSITGVLASVSSPVTITVSNSTSTGQGGNDAEGLESARTNIPFYARTNNRAVTLDDYQTIATSYAHPTFGSVSYAIATIRTENALLEGNIVVLYAWTTGVGGGLVNLSPQLAAALQDFVQTAAVGTDLVQVFNGSSVPVPISLRFETLNPTVSVTATAQLVSDTIKSIILALRPGQPLIFSDLVGQLDNVYGIKSVNIATPIADLTPSNSTELFTVLQSSFVYAISRTGVGTPFTTSDGVTASLYTAQLPVTPLQAWSFNLFLGPNQLTVVPGATPGFAELYGANLSTSTDTEPPAVALVDPESSQNFKSTVDLLTGQVRLWLVGAPGDLTMTLNQVIGYSTDRSVNVYIGYTGDNSQTNRRAIRAALRTWSNGLPVGGSIYGVNIPGILASNSNVQSVVAGAAGVNAVTRVALDTPANTATSVLAQDTELLRLGNIVLNNQVDVAVGLLIPAAMLVFTAWCSTFMS